MGGVIHGLKKSEIIMALKCNRNFSVNKRFVLHIETYMYIINIAFIILLSTDLLLISMDASNRKVVIALCCYIHPFK